MKILRCLIALSVVLLPLGLRSADAGLAASGLAYHKAGKAVTEMVIAKQIDMPALSAQIDTLVKEAVVMAEAYAKAYPAGKKLLDKVVASVPAMRALSFDELQTDWHDLGVFGKPGYEIGIDLKDEDNEHFTDPIHAIVHPMLVLKAAQAYSVDKKEDNLKAMKEEMEEGLEQAEKLIAKLSR